MILRRRHAAVILIIIAAFILLRRGFTQAQRAHELTLETFQHRHPHHTKMDTESECPFCKLSKTYSPGSSPVPRNPDPELVSPNCHLILSTDHVLAFLDIMPITQGHVLVVPRLHREKLGDLRGGQGAALGAWLPVVSRATMKALGREGGDWNVVQNNGISAAQVVPHVHYHIIPRGGRSFPELKARSWTIFGKGQREELDDEEGVQIAAAIRKELEAELEMMKTEDVEGSKLLAKL